MEQILKEILSGINDLKIDVNSLKNDVNSLKNDVNDLKTEQIKTNERLTNLELGQKEIKEQLTGFQNEYTETMHTLSNKIDNIDSNIKTLKTDLLTVEAVTGKNMADIAYLKAIK